MKFFVSFFSFVYKVREDMKKGVYVENLSEFEVHTVGDILQLLTQVIHFIIVFPLSFFMIHTILKLSYVHPCEYF